MPASRLPLRVALDRVRSVYNVGAFFRTGDAAGIERLYLGGYTGHPPHPGIAKTALGAEEALAWEHHRDLLPALRALKDRDYELIAVETGPDAVDLYEWEPRFPVCLVFGNEVDGVAPEIVAACDAQVRLPMHGVKETLNVAVAGGVVLFEMLRKYRERER